VPVKLADDGSDEVNVNDLEALIGLVESVTTAETMPDAEKADIYNDGILNAMDITALKRFLIKNALRS
jgi:hypothetical protein